MIKTNRYFWVFSILLLIYLILPGPGDINNFAALSNSYKSWLSGDTVQIPNVVAYFSNNFRKYVTNFYYWEYRKNTYFPLPPIRLNYPPEYAFNAIKTNTDSTYLEEFVYPLRDSLFVNGFEPFLENGKPRYSGAVKFFLPNKEWVATKVTLRYYPSTILSRIILWIGINLAVLFIINLTKEVLKND